MLMKMDLIFMVLQIRSRRLFMALEFFKEHQDRSVRARGTMFRGDGCLEEKGQQRWVQGNHLLEVSPLGILVKIVVTPDLDPF